MTNLKLLVMENCKELGQKINEHLKLIRNDQNNYVEITENSRFRNGEGKINISDDIRNKDIYVLSDVGNYGLTYKLHNFEHHISPDEHFQDIKRTLLAIASKGSRVNVIMPLLYQSRQDKREKNESLDCALALQELERLNTNSIITFDAHNACVSNAIPNTSFENFFANHTVLEQFLETEKPDLNNLLVISPDTGAIKRTRYFAEMLGCNIGIFDKRRDLTKVVNGKNPIVAHEYIGESVKGKDVIIVDDMIASGGSMIDVIVELKKRGANKVYLTVTFALFTEGADIFKKAFKEGLFDKLYVTNLSYVPTEIKDLPWYYDVDCSYQIANIIDTLNRNNPTDELYNGKQKIFEKVRELKK